MRKFLTILNAMLRDRQPFRDKRGDGRPGGRTLYDQAGAVELRQARQHRQVGQ